MNSIVTGRLSNLALALLLAALVAMAEFGLGQQVANTRDQDAARAAIMQLHARHDDALSRGDTQEWARWYRDHTTPDYREKQWRGKVSSRAQVIEAMEWVAAQPGIMAGIHLAASTRLDRLSLQGEQAVADVTEWSRVVQRHPTKHTVSGTDSRRETWVKVGTEWKMRRSEELSHRTVIDGVDYSRKDRPVTSSAEAEVALETGRTAAVTAYAKKMLIENTDRRSWQYGNIVYEANELLGRAALREGHLADARRYLLEAGRTPGSPQLDSFGPANELAKELLQKGERRVVLEYLDLISRFWAHTPDEEMRRLKPEQAALFRKSNAHNATTLARWRADIQAGRTPSEWK